MKGIRIFIFGKYFMFVYLELMDDWCFSYFFLFICYIEINGVINLGDKS